MRSHYPPQIEESSDDTETTETSSDDSETETKISSYQAETSSQKDTDSEQDTETSSEHTITTTRKSQRLNKRNVLRTRCPRRPVSEKHDTTSDSSDDYSRASRRKTARFSHNVGQRRARKASFVDNRNVRRNMRKRTVPSVSLPLPRENDEDDSDEQGFVIINKSTFRKTKHSSNVRLSANKYQYNDYADEVEEVDEDVFMFHATLSIGKSSKKRLYKGDTDEDTDSEERPFQKTDKVGFQNRKEFSIRQNGGWDEANSSHPRRRKMSRESVNDNITAHQHEELSSGIASRTRLKMLSVKKMAEVGKDAMDLSDDDNGYNGSGSDDPEVKIAYVSDISDSQPLYCEDYVTQNNVIYEESTKDKEDCNGMERNSNKHVIISSDDEPKEREKQKVPSSKESVEKENEINKAPQENEEINTILADKTTLKEEIQVNINGEREGSSLKHVLNEHRNQEKEKERDEAVIEKPKVISRKKQNGEINTARAGDVTTEKLRVKNNVTRKKSTTVPYAYKSRVPREVNRSPSKNQSRPDTLKQANVVSPDDIGKNSPAVDGMNTLQSPNQSRSEMLTQTKVGSSAVAEDKGSVDIDNPVQKKTNETNSGNDVNEETVATEDKDCDDTDNGVRTKTDEGIDEIGEMYAADKIEKRRKLTTSRPLDLFKMLADSVLERVPLIESESDDESKQAPTNTPHVTLPLKFIFEDEKPEKAEKTEFEVMVAGLFDDMYLALEMEQGSSEFPETYSESECSPTEETHDARCARGLHELTLEEDEGLYCIYCCHVELDARDILPEWVQNTRRIPGRKRSADIEDFPEFVDEQHVESSMKNSAALNCTNDGTVWDVIPGVRDDMYKHQQEGFEFLWKNLAGSTNIAELNSPKPNEVGGCIISHAPGTGKTRLTIVFIETYLKVFPDCRPVIVAPASMLLTWEEEFEKWDFPFPFHNLNNIESGEGNDIPKQFRGPRCQHNDTVRMVKMFLWNKGGSILGISYSLFEKLSGEKQAKDNKNEKSKAKISDEKIEILRQILLEKPGLVILDEGHTPRNNTSNIWNALLKLKTEKRVILSGTPFQNNFGELFNTLRLVRPAVAHVLAQDKMFAATLRRKKSLKRKHNQSGPISEVIDSSMLEKLKSIMLPFVNVHKGTILRESLPGLRDSVILLRPQEFQKSLINTLEGHQCTFEFEHKVALISVHPYLWKHCGSAKKSDLDIDIKLVEASKLNPNEGAKTKFIIELLRLSMATNEKVLIFSQYIQPLELIKAQLREVFKWVEGKQVLQMRGKLNQKHRQSLIKIYNDPLSEARVMLASTKCCSEGISLVGASRVVLLDVVWNPSVERQAICRAYRIGQKKFVYTYHLMTSGTTEGDKYCRQAEKERVSELVFCSSYGESDKKKNQAAGCIEDKILEKMVGCAKLTDMFEKILNQPKETDLIQTFGLTS